MNDREQGMGNGEERGVGVAAAVAAPPAASGRPHVPEMLRSDFAGRIPAFDEVENVPALVTTVRAELDDVIAQRRRDR